MVERWRKYLCLLLCVLAPAMLDVRRAKACATDNPRFFEHTAQTLRFRQVRLGLQNTQVGLLPGLTVGTQPLAWLVPLALGHLVPNVQAKLCVLPAGPLHVTVGAGLYYINTGSISMGAGSSLDSRLWVFPLDSTASLHFDDYFSVHARILFVRTAASSDGGAREIRRFAGAVTSSNLQLLLAPEVRVNRRYAVMVLGRILLQALPMPVSGSVHIDHRTSMQVEGTLTADNITHAWALLPSVSAVFGSIHLRVGVGYGHFFLPGLALPLPFRTPLVDLDVWWRF